MTEVLHRIRFSRNKRLSTLVDDGAVQLTTIHQRPVSIYQPLLKGPEEPPLKPAIPEAPPRYLKQELCELTAYIVPPLMSDLLKLLVMDKHGKGVTVRDILQKEELKKTDKLLKDTQYIKHFNESYYLLPVDERGNADPSRPEGDTYLLPVEKRVQSMVYTELGKGEADTNPYTALAKMAETDGEPEAKTEAADNVEDSGEGSGLDDQEGSYSAPQSPDITTPELGAPENLWTGPYMEQTKKANPYSSMRKGARKEESMYEALQKQPSPEEVAQIYHLLRQLEMTGLEMPKHGWFSMPEEGDLSSSANVALITYVATNITEFLDSTDTAIEKTIDRLDQALKSICALLDKCFPSPKPVAEQISYYKGMKTKPEIFDHQLLFLQNVAISDSKLRNTEIENDYDAMFDDEDVYDEILEEVYDEIKLPEDEPPKEKEKEPEPGYTSLVPKEPPPPPPPPKKTFLSNLADNNKALIEKAITVSTLVQESGDNVSTASKNEASKVSSNIVKAKQAVEKVVQVIKDEIQKIKDRIAKRRDEIRRRKREERRRQAHARKQSVPLPDVPAELKAPEPAPDVVDDATEDDLDDGEEYDEIVLDDEHIYDELDKEDQQKLEALMKAEEKNENVYEKLSAVGEVLYEVIAKKEKGYYVQLVERNQEYLAKKLKLKQSHKESLIEERIISMDDWNKVDEKGNDSVTAETLLKIVIEKGDYSCKRFLEYLRLQHPKLYTDLWNIEEQWRTKGLQDLLQDKSATVNWDMMIATIDPAMACSTLERNGTITLQQKQDVLATMSNDERRVALLELVNTREQEDWDNFVSTIKHEEAVTKEMFDQWDELDWLANWEVLMKHLDVGEMCSILFSRFILTPRQYADLTAESDRYRKQAVLEVILSVKGKEDWKVAINSLRDKGQGHMVEELNKEQTEVRKALEEERTKQTLATAAKASGPHVLAHYFATERTENFAYDEKNERIYVGASHKIKVLDMQGNCLDTIKRGRNSRFTVDTERNRILYWNGPELKYIPLSDTNRKSHHVIKPDNKRGHSKIVNVYYMAGQDLYLMTHAGQSGITLFDPKTSKVVGDIPTDNDTTPEAVACGVADDVIALSGGIISRYDLGGRSLARYPLKSDRVDSKKISSIALDRHGRIMICDTGFCRLVRILADGSWEHTIQLKKKLTGMQVGLASGSLVVLYKDGMISVFQET